MISKTNILNKILLLNSAPPLLQHWDWGILGYLLHQETFLVLTSLFYGVEGGNTEERNSHLLSVHHVPGTIKSTFSSIKLWK